MGLDIRTLFVVDVAVLLMTAAVSFTLWFQHRAIAGLLWWSFATAAEGLAMLIVGLFGPVLPPAMGLPAALLFVGGFLMVWESMRRFNGGPAAKGRLVIFLLAFAAVLISALFLGAALHQRAGLLMLALALCAAASAWEVTFGGTPPLLRSRFALTVVFSVIGVLLARQAVLTGLLLQDDSATSWIDLLGDGLPMINSIGILSLCFGLVMMASERASSRYRKLALTDDLTGLPNRRFLLEQGGRLGRKAGLYGSAACVLMMDLDHFAEVNKRFGHAGGDTALVAFAGLLQQYMRPTDTVARYGGEEFCALLMGTDIEEATGIAERLREGVAGKTIDLGGHAVKITVSIGIAHLRGGDLAASMRDADAALYRAKALGRNRVAAGEGDMVDPPRATKTGLRIVR
jgi:diguanylate cyclase (GGDEF)-like protein